jgi:hypothetical protein
MLIGTGVVIFGGEYFIAAGYILQVFLRLPSSNGLNERRPLPFDVEPSAKITTTRPSDLALSVNLTRLVPPGDAVGATESAEKITLMRDDSVTSESPAGITNRGSRLYVSFV